MTEVVVANSYDELKEILDNNDDVVVDFSALAWCIPCQRFKPHFDKAAENLPNIKFVYVDADTMDRRTSEEFPVQSVPTVIRIKDGVSTNVSGRTVVQLMKELS